MSRQACHRCGASYEGAACHLCGDTLLSHAAKDPLLGKILAGRYKILRKLGQGGMGAVYLAEQVGIGHRVALKLLNQQLAGHEEIIQRFMNEAKSYARIAHPHAVAFHEFGQDAEGNLFISTEYIEGPDLKKYLIERGRLQPSVAFEVILQIADALEHAHRNGVIHRDLKPENVIVREGIRGIHAKVLDFGIARLLEEGTARLTVAGNIAGTPQYMSPEQVRGHDVDARADVYVIGVVLFELLTGLQPYAAPTVPEMLYRQAHDPVPPLTNFLPGLESVDRVIQRATAKKPDARHPSMAAFAADLLEAMGELPPELVSTRSATPAYGMSPPAGVTDHGGGSRPQTALGTPAAAGMHFTEGAEGPHGTMLSAASSPTPAQPQGTLVHGERQPAPQQVKAHQHAHPGGTLPLAGAASDTLLNERGAAEAGSSDTLLQTRAAVGDGAAPSSAAGAAGSTAERSATLEVRPPGPKGGTPGASPAADRSATSEARAPGQNDGTPGAGSASRRSPASGAGAPDPEATFDWEARERGSLRATTDRKPGKRSPALVAGLFLFVAASAGAGVGYSQGWFGEGWFGGGSAGSSPAPGAAPVVRTRPVEAKPAVAEGSRSDEVKSAAGSKGVEAKPAIDEPGEAGGEGRLRRQFLAKEIWLKANAEFLSGNLATAGEILGTVPEEESIAADVVALRSQIEEISGLLAKGRAAAHRGDCVAAIAAYDKILSRYPGLREAENGRRDCKRMLPPTLAE